MNNMRLHGVSGFGLICVNMLTCILDNSLCETEERQIIGLTDDTIEVLGLCVVVLDVFSLC